MFFLLVLMMVGCGMLFAATSVSEQVGTAQEAATGTVVTIGLSNYDGVQFSLSGGVYAAAQPGAMAIATGSGSGNKYGPGARLQYTLYGLSGTYKITATTDEAGHNKVFVGITEMTAAPTVGERTSGSLGTISLDTEAATDYNGDDGAARDYGLAGDEPAMFKLLGEVNDVLITGIASGDTWTGTTTSSGPQLYYELTDPISCSVTYTISAES